MSRAALRALAAGPALFFVAGCCCFVPAEPQTTIVVVPSRHDGHVGAVVVHKDGQAQVLHTAYAAVTMGTTGELKQATLKPREIEQVRKTFEVASAALPPKALTYVLYFDLASENLTPESSQTLDTLLAEVAHRAAAEIVVVGHSDSLGDAQANLVLSQRRADRMRELVIQRGAKPDIVQAVGVGEKDPEVQTGDDIEEARNRRVEITVR